MKFVKLRMINFMRYKGENVINFSRDDKKNVTVVLGDNAVGKTTLAQAFRWALYGEIINTQYDESKKVCILNNEVLGDMTANAHKSVETEIVLEKQGAQGIMYEYRIIRKASFIRKFPQLVAKQQSESLKMYITNTVTGESTPYDNVGTNGRDSGKVDELISELLPKNLSAYFLFDGERWSDERTRKNDIKDSVYNLVGISPIREMKRHLGECGTQGKLSVIKQLKSKITGSGDEYKNLENKIERYLNNIEREENTIEDAQKNAEYYQQKADEIEQILLSNPNVEFEQKECESLKKSIASSEIRMKNHYADIINAFSTSHPYFAAKILQDLVDMLGEVDLEGVDIPGVTDKTIDFLLEKRTCLCGHRIEKDSEEEKALEQLKKVVPPAVIGTIVGNFQDKIFKWDHEGAEIYSTIQNKAQLYQAEYYQMLDEEEELERKERKIDRKINFAQERLKMNSFSRKAREERERERIAKLNIEEYKTKIEQCEKEKEALSEKTEANMRLQLYIAYAEELYASSCHIYQNKESKLLSDLNEVIERNFKEMFNEQEKIARLGEDYVLRLYYKRVSNSNGYSDMEATGLSEGEKIARNFAFIVSILELANRRKEEGDDIAQSLPLVLDGPFSKLGTVNTSKVAKVLPSVSEQVIIFMLDKDWEPSGLDEYTDKAYMYRTVKDAEENSSSICQGV